MADELTRRLRLLDAERLRPVPAPGYRPAPLDARRQLRELRARYRDDPPSRLNELVAALDDDVIDQHQHETPGPRASEPTRKDR